MSAQVCRRARLLVVRHAAAFKNMDQKIVLQQNNPKKAGTKAWERFEKYKHATTIGEANQKGANWQDMSSDFEKGFLRFVDGHGEQDSAMPAAAKRPAPEGTPDRESQARAKMQLAEVVPQVVEVDDPVTKVEMSASTIAALRAMLREEINHGMADVEGRLAKKLEDNVGQLKTEIDAERDARQVLEERVRQVLEERVRQLEKRPPTTTYGSNSEEEVDKNIAIIGGFAEKTIEEGKHLVREMMTHVHGFEDVAMTSSSPAIALAHFQSPAQSMKFIRGQKNNMHIQTNKLWVAENRSLEEGRRCKIASKVKKFLNELGEYDPKNVVVNYKVFKVMVRVNGKLMSMAHISGDGEVEWLDHNLCNDAVKEALDTFITELE